MQFTISREALLKPLQKVVGVVEKRQTMPILANVLMIVKNQLLSLTATDLEIEMIARIPLTTPAHAGVTTIPARKLIEICKALPEQAQISFELNDQKMLVSSARSRFTLACLSADNFPRVQESPSDVELSLSQSVLKRLLDFTSFAMAHQDVRYYLNGVCLMFTGNQIRMIATDGHRLATLALPFHSHLEQPISIIIPRKAVSEMQRLFAEGEEELGVVIGKNHIRIVMTHTSFISKLVEGKFPDYRNVLPTQQSQQMIVKNELFKQALLRVSALFTDKFRGVGLKLFDNLLQIMAVTTEKDEVEDEIEVEYQGPTTEIGVNASYLIEYLNIIGGQEVKATFTSAEHVVLFEPVQKLDNEAQHLYVVMPMRL